MGEGTTARPSQAAVAALSGQLRGRVISAADHDYDEVRALYNAMIDKRPAVIAQCADVTDVVAALRFGREQDLDIAIRSGGHNGPGLGSVDGGVVIDLSWLRNVRVEPGTGIVHVGGGALLGDVDHATYAFGRAVPGGIISTTGIGGLTLGGGVGHLSRGFGLTIDNLLGADVVLADGRLVRASAEEHPDLFWALRGGGGNFGVVTSFTFRSHEVGSPAGTVVAGPTFWPIEQTAQVARWYREFLPSLPRGVSGFFAVMTVPPGPPFPEELHLRKVCAVMWCSTFDEAETARLLAPVHEAGTLLLNGLMPMPLPMLQSAFDGLFPAGHQWYWRSDVVGQLSDEAAEIHQQFGEALPTMQSTMHMYPIDGAVHDVGADDTAWAYRDARWVQVMVGVDPDPAKAPELRDWAVGYWEGLHPHSLGGSYVNMMMEEGHERVRSTYGSNYERLVRVKSSYDPENAFHVNQNIPPAAGIAAPREPSDQRAPIT